MGMINEERLTLNVERLTISDYALKQLMETLVKEKGGTPNE